MRAKRRPRAPAAVDNRWPGGVMVLLILVGLGWPLVPLAAVLPTYLFVDRDQGIFLAGAGAASMLLHWALGA